MKCYVKNYLAYGLSAQVLGDVDPSDWLTSREATVTFTDGSVLDLYRDDVFLINESNEIDNAKAILAVSGYEVVELTDKRKKELEAAKLFLDGIYATLYASLKPILLDWSESEIDLFIKTMAFHVAKLKCRKMCQP